MKFSTTLLAFAAIAAPTALFAQAAPKVNYVTLSSESYVARVVTDENGNKRNELQEPKKVLPGDRLVFVVKWNNQTGKPATNFVIDNPIPKNTSFTGARDPMPVMSIDGGKAYGALATLKKRNADGTLREAVPQDVTHLRWKFAQPVPIGNSGSVAFFAVVK